jgi:uncharacterized protein (TIRG00374 family)
MASLRRGNFLSIAAILLGLVILGLLASLSDIRKLAEIGRGLAPGWILSGSIAGIVSFWLYGLCFAAIVGRLVRSSAMPDIVRIGYVSFTFSELLVSGGLSGYAVRGFHLAGYGISYLETLIYSLARACIHYCAIFLAFLLSVGLFIPSVPDGIGGDVILFQFLLFAGLLAYAVRIFSSAAARNRWIRLAGFLLNTVARVRGREQWFGSQRRQRVEEIVERAIGTMRRLGWRLPLAFLLDGLGLGLRFTTLYCAFLACGYAIEPGIMVAGFIIGTFWAFFVQIPGQMGVMEGAVSGVFTTFGIPFEVALIACVLYRLTYSLLPFLVGLVALPRLARRTLSSLFRDRPATPSLESQEGD